MTDSPTKTAEQVKFEVDSIHHIHGSECLCGFKSDRSRSRTEHITEALLSALAEAGLLVSGAPSEELIARAERAELAIAHLKEWLEENRPLRCIIDYGSEGEKQDDYASIMAVLTAAGVGSPVPVQVDETKLAEVIGEAFTERRPGEGIAAGAARRAVERQDEWLRGGAQ